MATSAATQEDPAAACPDPTFSSDPAATHGDPAVRPLFASPHTYGAHATGEDPSAPKYSSSSRNDPGPALPLAVVAPDPGRSSEHALVVAGGDTASAPLFFSPGLARALVDQPACVASVWPSFAALRSAAHATKPSRLRLVTSALVSEARLVFAACFLLARSAPLPSLSPHSRTGAVLHHWISTLLVHGTELFMGQWRWDIEQCQFVHAHLAQLANPIPWLATAVAAAPFDITIFAWDGPTRPYPAALCAFLHALRVGAPWALALDAVGGLAEGFFSPDGRIFATPALGGPHGRPDRRVDLSPPGALDALTLFFAPVGLVAIASSHSLLPRMLSSPTVELVMSRRGAPFATSFLPAYIKLKKVPTRDVMSVYRSLAKWHLRLGPLDATAAMVAGGQLNMPKPRLTFRHSARPNHASWERNEAAKIALGPKFATWAWQGIVEMVPRNCPLPLFIEPLGAVDKATDPFHRLILDARLSNEFQDPWGVWYSSIMQLAALLDVCDIMFAEDLEDAYHLSIFAGCTGKPFWTRVFAIDEHGCVVERWRLVMGCDASSCLGLCDKAMSGFCIDGFVGRFAAAHFGQRNAGSPLNVLMRCIQRFLARRAPPPAPVHHTRRVQEPATPPLPAVPRGLGPDALHSVVWVDDAVYITKTPPHPACQGLASGCPVCDRTARSSRRAQSGWHRLADELGLGLSVDKRQTPSQRVTYTGMVVDTFQRTISIPPDKKLRLAEFLEGFFDRREASLSDLASLRGRVQHYSACLPYVQPFVAFFSSVMGTEDKPDYDRVISLPPAVAEAAIFIRDVLEEFALRGRPLWPLVPSTLHAAFMAGETGLSHVAIITWDASLHGWGMVLRWWANKDGVVVIGTLPDSDDMRHQVRREALAGVLALEAAARVVNLTEAVVILRNDAVGALAALRKGSFSSTFLQQCAMRACRIQRGLRCIPLHLHAPGRVLIAEGVDDHSRAGALEVAGPVSSPRVRARSLELAAACGWTLTVDAFASESNSLLPRFYARYAEPNAEVEDAFTVADWAFSACPACGCPHRETLFAFPPPPLLNAFVAKARADGARAIVVTPLSVAAPFWTKLLRASVVANEDGYIRVRRQSAPLDSDVEGELAIFAVDFAPQSTRRRLDPCAPPCGAATSFRGRSPLGSADDQAERARIHAEILALGTALRPASPSP